MKKTLCIMLITLMFTACSSTKATAPKDGAQTQKDASWLKTQLATPSDYPCWELKNEIKYASEAIESAKSNKLAEFAKQNKAVIDLAHMYGGKYASNRFYHFRRLMQSTSSNDNKRNSIIIATKWLNAAKEEARLPRNNCDFK